MPSLISCERPERANPIRYTNFSVRNFVFSGDGTAVNSVFPLVRRVATLDLQATAAVMSMSLASSIINGTPLDTVGLFVAVDRGETLSLVGGLDLFLSHVCRQNSIVALPASSSRTNTLAFGEYTAYKLPSGPVLALYACSANAAANELSAVVSIFWSAAVG